jgi:glycosyltransferase involved in cell wall biosynthesis
LLEWGLQRAQRPKGPQDKIFYLGAAAPPNADGEPVVRRSWDDLAGKFVVTYVGTFGYYNSPLVLIEAARLLEERSTVKHRMAFVLAGDGVMRSKVTEAASNLHDVTFPGWVGSEDLPQLLRASTVAVLPWSSAASAFPNKAFHYLQAGLPIAASVTGELGQLLCEYNAGFSFQPHSSAQLAEHLERWFDDRRLVETMSVNAKRLAEERLDGSQIYAAFAAHVENIARAVRPSSIVHRPSSIVSNHLS